MDSKNACNMFFLTRLVRMKTKGLNCCIKYKFVKVDRNHVCTPSNHSKATGCLVHPLSLFLITLSVQM